MSRLYEEDIGNLFTENCASMRTRVFTGRCQCGSVQFDFETQKLVAWVCHCRECKRQSASAFAISVPAKRTGFKIEGRLTPFDNKAESGATFKSWFCESCGTRIYNESSPTSEYITLQGGTIDQHDAIQPLAHVWTKRKFDWVKIPDYIEQFGTQPEDVGAWRDKLLD